MFCASLGKPRASCRYETLVQFHQRVEVGQRRMRTFVLIQVHEFVPMKRSKESSSLFFLKGESKRMLSRLAAQRICGTNTSGNPKSPKSTKNSQVWTREGKEYKLRMLFCSANLGKPRVTYGSEDSGSLSLRDASLGKPRICAKDLSPDFKCKGSSGQGIKGGHKEGTQNNKKETPLCFIDGHELVDGRRFFFFS